MKSKPPKVELVSAFDYTDWMFTIEYQGKEYEVKVTTDHKGKWQDDPVFFLESENQEIDEKIQKNLIDYMEKNWEDIT